VLLVEPESADASGVHVDGEGTRVGAEAEGDEEFACECGCCVVRGREGALAHEVPGLLRGA